MVTLSVGQVPVITVFVRHSADCRHRGEEFYKGCRCRKHLRWSHDGKQFRRSAKTRSWEEAEKNKRLLEEKFSPGKPIAEVHVEAQSRKTIDQAIELFVKDKRNEGRKADVLHKYKRELSRLQDFMERRGKFFPAEIDADDLTEFLSNWAEIYPSSITRNRVLTRLRAFLKFCYNRKWTERIAQTVYIKAAKPDVHPLTAAQYNKLLAVIPKEFPAEKAKKAHALVQLMRWSGLAVRDAVTLERDELQHDSKQNVYRVVTRRTKTDSPVNVRIPGDVAEEILAVANGNPRYLFWNSGNGTERTATTNWSDELRKLFRAAGLPKGHPHQLRHTFAVELLSNGIPLDEVSRALGHTSVKTTEKYYAKWVKARQDRLDDLIAGTWTAQRKELSLGQK